jgi:hypothetical protein
MTNMIMNYNHKKPMTMDQNQSAEEGELQAQDTSRLILITVDGHGS